MFLTHLSTALFIFLLTIDPNKAACCPWIVPSRFVRLAAAIASEPHRLEAQRKEAKAKLDSLHQEIARLDSLVNGTDETHVLKRRLDDSKELEQSKEGIEKVRSAVSMAMLKKKKKAKLSAEKKEVKKTVDMPLVVEEEAEASSSAAKETVAPLEEQPSIISSTA